MAGCITEHSYQTCTFSRGAEGRRGRKTELSCHLLLAWADRSTKRGVRFGLTGGPSRVWHQQSCASRAGNSTLFQQLQPPNSLPQATTHRGCETLNSRVWASLAQGDAERGQALALSVPVLTKAEERGKKKKSRRAQGSSLSLLLVCSWDSYKTGAVKLQEDDGWGIRQSVYFWSRWLSGRL